MNLVTGATGIIGSHVVLQLLQRGETVVAGMQKGSDVSKMQRLFAWYGEENMRLFEQIRWVELDVRDVFSVEDALDGITNVYHCAGYVSFDPADRRKLFAVNEQGTANVVNACLHKKTEALCHVSTIGTVNNAEYKWPLDESVFWKTSGKESSYALSKYNAEREVWRGMEEGLNAVIVNPGVVLSPVYWHQSSARLFRQCYQGNRFYTPGRTAYVAAWDVAAVMLQLMQGRHFSERFIVIENNYSFEEILGRVQQCLGKPKPSVKVGAGLLHAVRVLQRLGTLFGGKPPVLTKAMINAAMNRQDFSNKKVREVLGTEFEPVEKTIAKICEYYLLEQEKSRSSL